MSRTVQTAVSRKPTARQIAAMLKRCLEEGGRVDIDRLGEFRLGENGEILFTCSARPRVFIAYVEEDEEAATRLCEDLRRQGCDPWIDRERLLPGQNWLRRIESAIEFSDAFVALFSARSIRKRGQFQSELRYAIDCARRIPLDQPFIFPARLGECHVPKRITSAIQYVDLFPDWDLGVKRLLRSIREVRQDREPRS
ncbi:MAG: TIR domain-containing protein [Bryobacterales bacterium]|nr:TIR domain-containing protein [Bryobacterales bacterium]